MKTQINSLQVFRGFAALAVVASHTRLSTEAFIGDMPYWADLIFDNGHLGVDFFFVLSGFIMMYIHHNDEPSLENGKYFFLKRLVRIFPAYLPVSIALVLLYTVFPGFSASGREYSLISSLLLVPSDLPPALSVAWTLIHELVFYSLFLTFFISKKIFAATMFVWVLTIITIDPETSKLKGYWLNPINIEFIFGIIAALVFKKFGDNKELKIPVLLLMAIGLLIIVMSFNIHGSWSRIVFAGGLSFLIIGFIFFENHYEKFKFPAFLLLLGNASYSIYLTHNPLLSVTQRIISNISYIDWALATIIGVVASVLFGIIYYYLIEKPAINYFGMKIRRV